MALDQVEVLIVDDDVVAAVIRQHVNEVAEHCEKLVAGVLRDRMLEITLHHVLHLDFESRRHHGAVVDGSVTEGFEGCFAEAGLVFFELLLELDDGRPDSSAAISGGYANLHLVFFSVGFALSFSALGVGTLRLGVMTSVMVTWPYGFT